MQMSLNLYGNINGAHYRAPEINLFEKAKENKMEQIRFSDTIGVDKPEIKVNISGEGLRALHGSKLNGSQDWEKTSKEIEFMTYHQPLENYMNMFPRMLPSNYEKASNGEYTFVQRNEQEKADALVKGFESLYDEIKTGYAEGTRVRFVEDDTSDDGFRRISMNEEVGILKDEFEKFLHGRFGEEHQIENILQRVNRYMEENAA